eukprot:gene17191-20483_t
MNHTITDFWRMCWENGCLIIVMLSKMVESDKPKCDPYWPDTGYGVYGSFRVTLVRTERDAKREIVKRVLVLVNIAIVDEFGMWIDIEADYQLDLNRHQQLYIVVQVLEGQLRLLKDFVNKDLVWFK